MQDSSKQLPLDNSFLTKDAEVFSEFDGHVGCREYTKPRDGESSTPKGWIRENTKIGLVLQVTTNNHQGKPRIEVRFASLSGDVSHSCVRISNGLNTFVTDLTGKTRIHCDDENNSASTARLVVQETRTVKLSQAEAGKPAAKLKPKPTSSPISSTPQTSIPIRERNCIGVEHQGATQKDAPSFSYFEKDDCIAQTRNSSSKRRWSN